MNGDMTLTHRVGSDINWVALNSVLFRCKRWSSNPVHYVANHSLVSEEACLFIHLFIPAWPVDLCTTILNERVVYVKSRLVDTMGVACEHGSVMHMWSAAAPPV